MMRFFPKGQKITGDQQTRATLKKAKQKMADVVDNFQGSGSEHGQADGSFGDKKHFRNWNKEFFITALIEQLFDEGRIDFFHRDISYDACEIMETEQGTVLCLPAHIDDVEDLYDLVEGKEVDKEKED